MVSLITFLNAHNLISPVVSSFGLGTNLKIGPRAALTVVKRDRFGVFIEFKKTRSGVLCKGSLESEVELALEREILEFMKNSSNPDDFPTKKELLDAGRIDLVNAIIQKGGWLALGWDDSDDEHESERIEFDELRGLQTRLEGYKQSNDEYDPSSSSCSSSLQSASPSGRSTETVVNEDTGIEGILSRLEKHRNLSFGISMGENGYGTYALSKNDGGHTGYMSADVAAEIYYGEKSKKGEEESIDKALATQEDAELQERHEINSNYIKSQLQHMQLELSSALCLLRSKSETLDPEGHKSFSNELQPLSDTWEFQENELMNAKDKLRSIRAELAVLEGKMALSIIDAQKIVEEKQRRIDSARRTLQLLRTACIVWPNSASEVLLAGSFDGWTTQRKMEKSTTGIFSLTLKLYPGRYEIKFIVDSVWRVDPLRPIVNNNGYENNVFIIHE